MFKNRMASEKLNSGFNLGNKEKYHYDDRVLDEVVEYILENHNNPTKIVESLSIVYEGKNILMLLLENGKFDSIQKLFTVAPIIFSNAKPLLHIDGNGENVLGYFIEFAPCKLLKNFIELMTTHCSPEDTKCLLKHKRNDGKTPLMILCTNEKFKSLESVFKMIVDCLASVCGLDSMYNALTTSDAEGDNMLILAIKHKNFAVGSKILDLLTKTIPNLNDRSKIENEIILSCDSKSNNPLMLLASESCDGSRDLQETILEILQNHLDASAVISLGRANVEGNNALMLAMITQNTHLSDKILEIIKSAQKGVKISLLSQICAQYNKNNDNFITLALLNNRSDIYLRLISEMEANLPSEKITELFNKTLSLHNHLLHSALSVTDTNAIISIIKYVRRIKTLESDEKHDMSNLIMKKDCMNRTLLTYAIANSNLDVTQLILEIAREFCTPLTLTLILTSRDSTDQTPYILSKLQNNKNLVKCIQDFAISTNNLRYIESQDKEVYLIKKQQTSEFFPLAVKIFH
jgi:hypothetical protein